MKVEFYRHNVNETDIRNVAEVLHSIFLTTGPVTADFEKSFAEYTGNAHIVGVNSCTAAIHLSLLALGVGPGDEVITTPLTFIATATAILHTGAQPVFVDVEEDTGLMDLSQVESAVTSKTKAIIAVHLYGSMVDMRELKRIADRNRLAIVEDSAHCIEGERDGVRPGMLSDTVCYSFYATKNLACGEGGAAATNNSDVAARMRILRLHGMSKDAVNRYDGYYQHWDMEALGWKYNMDDIHAALLVDQIERIEGYYRKKTYICERYDRVFGKLPGVKIPERPGKSGLHLYTIWVDPRKRDEYLHRLQQNGIGVAVNYRAIHTLTYFRDTFGFRPNDFPVAKDIGDRTISLPFYARLTEQEIEYVIQTVREVVTTQ